MTDYILGERKLLTHLHLVCELNLLDTLVEIIWMRDCPILEDPLPEVIEGFQGVPAI